VGERGFNDERQSITEMLKTKRPLKRDEKDELWQRFHAMCRHDTQGHLDRRHLSGGPVLVSAWRSEPLQVLGVTCGKGN